MIGNIFLIISIKPILPCLNIYVIISITTEMIHTSKIMSNIFLLFAFSLSTKNHAEQEKKIKLPIAPLYCNAAMMELLFLVLPESDQRRDRRLFFDSLVFESHDLTQ